jgi:hypothetical protein
MKQQNKAIREMEFDVPNVHYGEENFIAGGGGQQYGNFPVK